MYPIRPQAVRAVMVNKVLGLRDLEPHTEPPDNKRLHLVARDVPMPEFLPYSYAYVDIYTDGVRAYADVDPRFHDRSKQHLLEKGLAGKS